jgi:hypothetical protein
MPGRPKTLLARIRKPNRFSQTFLRLKWINFLERTGPLDSLSTSSIGIEGKRNQPNDAEVGYAPGLFGVISVSISTSVMNHTGDWAEINRVVQEIIAVCLESSVPEHLKNIFASV